MSYFSRRADPKTPRPSRTLKARMMAGFWNAAYFGRTHLDACPAGRRPSDGYGGGPRIKRK